MVEYRMTEGVSTELNCREVTDNENYRRSEIIKFYLFELWQNFYMIILFFPYLLILYLLPSPS